MKNVNELNKERDECQSDLNPEDWAALYTDSQAA
jgi:hypothetical protein